MSSAEFSLHAAYWRREPTGPGGQMQLWAALMAATMNGPLVRRDKKMFRSEDVWPGTQWNPPPAPPPPGAKRARMAPDFSSVRGLRVANKRK
jgi:hypothetical protein